MPTFYLTVGVAASGKTTWAFSTAKIEDTVLDSDTIREELYGNWADQSHNAQVFDEMYHRTVEAMKRGIDDIYYVATNLSMKRRIQLLERLRKMFPQYIYRCRVFVRTPNTLYRQNYQREHCVPMYVIDRQLAQFQLPVENEGWDNISYDIEKVSDDYYNNIWRRIKEFGSQDNPHHTLPLHIHMNHCVDKVPHDGILDYAAAWHDVGKVYTQSFDENGIAHYYGHAEYGAQLTLLCGLPYEVALLVNYHMLGYESEKAQTTWRQRLGDELWEKLITLHRADEAAH